MVRELRTPEERSDAWQTTIQQFANRNRNLDSEQLGAIFALSELGYRTHFSQTLDPASRGEVRLALEELGRALPHTTYLKLIRSFGELRPWLVKNELASQSDAALPNCNCTYSHHCQSGTCRDIACEPSGTTHTGVCKATKDDEEEVR
jgi:hypothetical protein